MVEARLADADGALRQGTAMSAGVATEPSIGENVVEFTIARLADTTRIMDDRWRGGLAHALWTWAMTRLRLGRCHLCVLASSVRLAPRQVVMRPTLLQAFATKPGFFFFCY